MPDARINVPSAVARGKPFEVRIIVRHPMETGYRTDDSGKAIPRNVIRTLVCRYDNDVVFSAKLSSGIAANPYLQFYAKVEESGTFKFTWTDDDGTVTTTEEQIKVV